MKKILILFALCMPLAALAQTETDRVAALQAEAAAKAKAAQEAARVAQEAARAAQEAAEAAAEEARKAAQQAEQQKVAPVIEQQKTVVEQPKAVKEEPKTIMEAPKAEEPKQVWTTPQQSATATQPVSVNDRKAEKAEKAEELKPYLAIDAVPVVNGNVQWELNVSAPGKSASQLYNAMFTFMTQLTQGENQLERSKVAIVNEQEHSIVATMQEWLTFTSNFISLDRTKFNYVLIANCKDNHVQVLLNRISYDYPTQGKEEYYKAEEWITDKLAVNKKRTRLYPISGKFRRKTIDRKNEIFNQITAAIKGL